MEPIKTKLRAVQGREDPAAAVKTETEAEQIEFAQNFVSGFTPLPHRPDIVRADTLEAFIEHLSNSLPEGVDFNSPLCDALTISLQTLFGTMGLTSKASVILQGEQAVHVAGLRDEIRTLTLTLTALHEDAEVRRLEQHNQAMERQEVVLSVQRSILEELQQNIAKSARRG